MERERSTACDISHRPSVPGTEGWRERSTACDLSHRPSVPGTEGWRERGRRPVIYHTDPVYLGPRGGEREVDGL